MSRPGKGKRPAPATGGKRPVSKRPLLALSMIARDEEENLRRLLPPIASAFDEIVVADTGSKDATRAVLREVGATVVEFPWRDDFAAARNAALGPVTARWVVWLDADDAFDPEDAARLRRLLEESPPKTAYYFELVNEGRTAGERSSCRQLRVFPRLPGVVFEGRIHEQVVARLERAGASFANAPIRVRHRGYLDPASVRTKFERNLRILDKERTERPSDPFVLFHLAQTHAGLARRPEAHEAIATLLAVPRGEGLVAEMAVRSRLLAARLHEEVGDRASARGAIEEALREGPDDPLARLHAAKGRLEGGDAAGAAALLEPLVAGEGLRPGILPYPVAAAGEAAKTLFAESLALLVNLGNAALARGDRAAAEASYRRAARVEPPFLPARENLAKLLLITERGDEALPLFEAVLEADPSRVDLLGHVGDIHLARGRPARAALAFEKLLFARPRAHVTWSRMGDAYWAQGVPEAARMAWKKALEIAPDYDPARSRLAQSSPAASAR